MKHFLLLLVCFAVVLSGAAPAADAKEENVLKTIYEKLETEPALTVKLDVKPGTNPKILLNDRAVDTVMYGNHYGLPETQKTADKIDNFHKGNINLIFLGTWDADFWNKDGSVNVKPVLERVERVLELNPDAYVCLALCFSNPPAWWMEKNPDELTDYAAGGVDPKASVHIHNIKAPSYASLKWRKDLTDVIRKIVTEVEASPLGKRVFSYRIDYGVYLEWHYYGMTQGLPGACKCMQAAFKKYLAGKYKSDQALQKAWNDPAVTLETAAIPSAEERNASIGDGATLRDPVKQVRVIDFLHCLQYELRDFVLACNTTVKESCGYRKLCGNYHGYLFGMHYPVEAWHLENETLLDSDVVDWQSSPNLYSHREIDDAEMGRAPVESYTLRGKLNIQEHDSRTYLATSEGYHRHVFSMQHSVTTLARDFVQTLCRNAGCWYMDFALDWYNDPNIFAFFRKMSAIRKLAENNQSVAQVAILADLESVYYYRIGTTDIDLMFDANIQEITHAAVPFDVLYFNDLKNPKVSDYKVYVVANLFYVTPEKEAIIRKLQAAGKTIVWLYAPGYLTPKGHGVADVEKLTGFSVKERFEAEDGRAVMVDGSEMAPKSTSRMNPAFAIEDKEARVLAYRTAEAKEVTFASKKVGKSTAYYTTTGFLSLNAWKTIFEESGVHCYENSGKPVVWASSSFVSIHGREGIYTLTLPEARKITQLLPEKVEVSPTPQKSFDVELSYETGIRLFYLE